jgi:hypothetical protein
MPDKKPLEIADADSGPAAKGGTCLNSDASNDGSVCSIPDFLSMHRAH